MGAEGKEAQIMELEEQAAQDRQSTTGTEEALTATGRIQVSPAETQPPEMVKIAHTSLIWSTRDRAWRAPPRLAGFAQGGLAVCWHRPQVPRTRAQQWTVVSGLSRVPTGHHAPC